MQCEPNVIIAVAEEFAKYVDGHDAQAAICIRFNVQDGKDGFIKNGISDIFRRIGVCCHLSQESVGRALQVIGVGRNSLGLRYHS